MNNGQHTNSPFRSGGFDASNSAPIPQEQLAGSLNLGLDSPSWNQPVNTKDQKPDLNQTKETENVNISDNLEKSGFMPPHEPLHEEILNPDLHTTPNSSDQVSAIEDSINHSAFKTTDKLSDEGIRETNSIIKKFEQVKTGAELAETYDLARGATIDNLENSFEDRREKGLKS